MTESLTWVVVVAMAGVGLAILIKFACRFPGRTIDDVIPYVQYVNLEELTLLLDPREEAILRQKLSGAEFRRTQRRRIHLTVEYLKRMSKNALVLAEWASLESQLAVPDQEVAFLRHELLNSAIHVRIYTLLALLKLRTWMLLRMEVWSLVPSPSLSDLREVAGIEMLESYARLKTAASSLSTTISEGHQTLLLRAL